MNHIIHIERKGYNRNGAVWRVHLSDGSAHEIDQNPYGDPPHSPISALERLLPASTYDEMSEMARLGTLSQMPVMRTYAVSDGEDCELWLADSPMIALLNACGLGGPLLVGSLLEDMRLNFFKNKPERITGYKLKSIVETDNYVKLYYTGGKTLSACSVKIEFKV